jgi:glutamate dehydrogenase
MSRLIALKSIAKKCNGNAISLSVARPFLSGLSTTTSFSTVAKSKSWVPKEGDLLQKVTTQSLILEVSEQSMASVKSLVPWFLKNMPASYFNQTDDAQRKAHIKAIGAIREFKDTAGLSFNIATKNENGEHEITIVSSDTNKGLLHNQISSLVVPPESRLSNVKVFNSLDNSLSLNVFTFQTAARKEGATREDADSIFRYVSELKDGKYGNDHEKYNDDLHNEKALLEYVGRGSPNYAKASNPRRFIIQRSMFEKVKDNDGVAIHIEPYLGPLGGMVPAATNDGMATSWISIGASNVLPEVIFKLSAGILKNKKIDIVRAHCDDVSSDPFNSTPEIKGYVTMLRLLVNHSVDEDFKQLAKELKRAKWVDDQVTDLGLVKYPAIGIDKAEIIVTFCSMLHGPLYKINNQSFGSIKTIISILDQSPHFMQTAEQIAQLFIDRFRPGSHISADEYTKRDNDLKTKISRLHHEPARILLNKLLEAVRATLRTNFYNEDRYALAVRVHPSIMHEPSANKPLPFGVLFAHGRHFNGFHNRFRDIARGGLRIVTPGNNIQYALESARQFDEAYGLSYAQQLKNKDIPEGGAKAVVLVNSPEIESDKRFFAARKSVKAFTDSILDLIVTDSVKNLVDYYQKDELIYLGPDEQVIPSDIDWICHRAAQRGYPIPAAFMSSKKGAGINHKEFGVTSEGIVVYLDVALKNVLKIDPRTTPFTIKVTGGPDGDVAGNLMKILFREYGDNCKIVGIADGFGVAEDPKGLDSKELLRLVEESLPITSFNTKRLSKQGIMLPATTEEGLQRRLSMCFRVKADAFVPAGGRPNTINIDNWKQFLDENGKPTSSLIVEGANIFTTPEAREALFNQAGVTIVKDSSANKCGVITSSCEVQASMLLSKDEFMEVKKELVQDVVVNLRNLARLEAELLFREYSNYPGALPHFSERISNAINLVTDCITDALENVQPNDPLFQELLPLVKDNLPKKLASVAWDRVPSRFPVQYQKNAIASTLASKLVYQEGIHLIETQPVNKIAERAFMYYREDLKIKELINKLETAKLSDKNEVIRLLKKGGTRASLEIF